MELHLYVAILRRYWLTVLLVPALAALISAGVLIAQPARYSTGVRLLITRGVTPDDSTAGLSSGGEDSTAQDMAAIVSGMTFKRDLAQELAHRGHPVDERVVAQSIQASNQQRVVSIVVTAPQPDTAVAIAQAAVDLLQRNGLRYWGETRVNAKQPGINVGVLDPPAPATLVDTPRTIAREVALRTLVGLLAGMGLAFARFYADGQRALARQRRAAPRVEDPALAKPGT
jgi:capsular polysaccharide biosynthesis protein